VTSSTTLSLGEKVKQLRTANKMTLEELANIAGSRKSYIWELENRGIKPSAQKLYQISQHFGVSLEYMVDDTFVKAEANEIDSAYFIKYRRLPNNTKKKIRDLIDTWTED